MSLLMDALKKAELAKHQGDLRDDGDKPELAKLPGLPEIQLTQPPANEQSSSPPLSLELLDNPPKQVERREPSLNELNTPKQEPETIELSLSPAPQLPKLPERMEDLDAQFMASAAPRSGIVSSPAKPVQKTTPTPTAGKVTSPPPAKNPPGASKPPVAQPKASAAPSKTSQDAVKNVFAAKSPQSVLTSAEPGKRSKVFAMTLGGLSLLSALSIGGYFWWQLQPKSGLMPMTPVAPMTPMPVVTAPPATALPGSLAPANASPPAPATQAASAVLPAPTLVEKPATPPSRDAMAIGDSYTGTARSQARQPPRQAESLADPDAPVRVTRAPLRVNPLLAKGFELFERGDLGAARRAYEQALKSDPHSIDALQGMAAISLRENRPDAAEHYFQRILLADPQDPHAIAGLANLRGHINPGSAESRLKGLIAAQPELSAPHFALGNLYSTQERWAEAQQAYFKAYSSDPGNPDILFNLAVSLEHLRQNKLAAQYYTLAIDAAGKRPAGFDAAQAAARLRTLQP